ncbi:acyl-CoA thioesterase [Leadbettera azotonutricia]|uniref:Thioesterase superfamily protein n=1 Tax=Leadbettera azotonutricia (strain ATCC BAA-888 / DSM 13862 / ZAS-9) TaxID=545695 RepID=F5YA00_LEAAZ|nr:thioesterase family protein [Leadbettera azotonutricia]AEF80452.1 thioesterase superfamily protein [Leadbettera azotonutricia ZAS-9]
MFSITVQPRFGDMDILGHINNTVPAAWCELAGTSVLKIFSPDLNISLDTLSLIVAHTDFDFLVEMGIKSAIEIKTWISKIGTSSFTIYHEIWQDSRCCVKSHAVLVCFNFITKKSFPIPEDKRKILEEHFIRIEEV